MVLQGLLDVFRRKKKGVHAIALQINGSGSSLHCPFPEAFLQLDQSTCLPGNTVFEAIFNQFIKHGYVFFRNNPENEVLTFSTRAEIIRLSARYQPIFSMYFVHCPSTSRPILQDISVSLFFIIPRKPR
jgi:hypothetical protein